MSENLHKKIQNSRSLIAKYLLSKYEVDSEIDGGVESGKRLVKGSKNSTRERTPVDTGRVVSRHPQVVSRVRQARK